jgi:hypothetical protein
MSTAPYPAGYPFAVSDAAAQHLASITEAPGLPVRRRANVNQARAIEKLGHAIDHLIYSRMFLTDASVVKAETDAVHLLMVLRRRVFEECETVVGRNRQVKQWIAERLRRTTN